MESGADKTEKPARQMHVSHDHATFDFIISIIIVHAKVHSKLQAFFNERFLDQDSDLESRVGPTISEKTKCQNRTS